MEHDMQLRYVIKDIYYRNYSQLVDIGHALGITWDINEEDGMPDPNATMIIQIALEEFVEKNPQNTEIYYNYIQTQLADFMGILNKKDT